jgi:hypothetical protein
MTTGSTPETTDRSAAAVRFTPAVAKRLHAIVPFDDKLNWTRKLSNQTGQPEGYYVQPTTDDEGGPRLWWVECGWSDVFWAEPVTYVGRPGEAIPDRTDSDQAKRLSAAQLYALRGARAMVTAERFCRKEGRERAYRLHRTLGREGIPDHAGFTSDVLGRPVEHLRLLSERECDAVRAAALGPAGSS